MNSHTNE